MPYQIHRADRPNLLFSLASLLRKVPEEEQQGFVDKANDLFRAQECEARFRPRTAGSDNPYWFEESLIVRADAYIAEGKPLRAYSDCLQEHNHGHSGFVDQTQRVYFRPTNDVERQVSEDLRQMIIRVADALMASNPSRLERGMLGEGPMSMIALVECLTLLGAEVPEELLVDFKRCAEEYRAANPDDQPVHLRVIRQAEERFGI